ncbi:hypothetical protein M3193_02115 [Sporosarcina luteola]|uniref:hypothetical protein n=1 Tax=Sporosarcina luteola TaxID=582850 RepID=UPI00203EDCA8|nr:hypothetical protein [Sporosarcina luteola]MCM3742927.1 hypothetical protein [Sporosarcina luteola]
MNKEFNNTPENWFADLVIEKFRAYAIVDVENKIQQTLLEAPGHVLFEERVSKLMEERSYYERASKVYLLADLIQSAKERFQEDEMSYAKAAFDLVLSKRKFSSYHKTL